MTASLVLQHVEVRTWPERTDILIIDQDRAMPLAHYDLEDVPDWVAPGDPIFDPTKPFEARAYEALRALEQDQERLCIQFETNPRFVVRLACTDEPRKSLDALLRSYGLSLEAVELSQLESLTRFLAEMPIDRLWSLMADWYDRAERRYPPGTSLNDPRSWIHRAHPSRADHFTHMAGGEPELASELLREMLDVPLSALTLYHLLQWSFFSRTEFAGQDCPPPAALAELNPGT